MRESGSLRPSGGSATASVAIFRGYWFPVFGCTETGTTAEEWASRRSGCPPFLTRLPLRVSSRSSRSREPGPTRAVHARVPVGKSLEPLRFTLEPTAQDRESTALQDASDRQPKIKLNGG